MDKVEVEVCLVPLLFKVFPEEIVFGEVALVEFILKMELMLLLVAEDLVEMLLDHLVAEVEMASV
jgi:hypothetical protein